jgi:acyl-CoA dehydrogenase
VLGGYFHLRAALAAPGQAQERLAHFYITRLLPEHSGLLVQARAGCDGLFALSPDDLAA